MKFAISTVMLMMCLTGMLHAEQEAAPNLLGDKLDSKSGWKIWIHQPVREAGAKGVLKDNTAILTPAPEGALEKPRVHWMQLYKDVTLEQDKKYILTFKTDAPEDCEIQTVYLLSKAPYTHYFNHTVKVKAGPQTHKVAITPKPSKEGYLEPRSLRLFCGTLKGETTLSDIKLVESK
ncbi:MAG: hypothetical protein ACF8OB_08015 [Phycisphaeraceae bacterium JB051]